MINSRIVLSIASIAAAGALIAGATFAFFSDSETSTGNTFAAGELDLQIDSEAHYAGLVCNGISWIDDEVVGTTRPDLENQPCEGTWVLKDLEAGDTFFALNDIKPGDTGENTISVHVFDNDAWGRMVVAPVQDLDNTCTEPEENEPDDLCTVAIPELAGAGLGELREALVFSAWLDQGATPGFQNGDGIPGGDDATEGDNIQQCVDPLVPANCAEPTVIQPGDISTVEAEETFEFSDGLALVYDAYCTGSPVDGHNNYGLCHGIADDGRLVGSATYYLGVDWELPVETGNEVQSDSLVADVSFDVEQWRNNPIPFGP